MSPHGPTVSRSVEWGPRERDRGQRDKDRKPQSRQRRRKTEGWTHTHTPKKTEKEIGEKPSGDSPWRPNGRERERERQATGEQKSRREGAAEGLAGRASAAESPLCSRAALRGFLRGRGKVVGARAPTALWTVISRIRAGAARPGGGPGTKDPSLPAQTGGS